MQHKSNCSREIMFHLLKFKSNWCAESTSEHTGEGSQDDSIPRDASRCMHFNSLSSAVGWLFRECSRIFLVNHSLRTVFPMFFLQDTRVTGIIKGSIQWNFAFEVSCVVFNRILVIRNSGYKRKSSHLAANTLLRNFWVTVRDQTSTGANDGTDYGMLQERDS